MWCEWYDMKDIQKNKLGLGYTAASPPSTPPLGSCVGGSQDRKKKLIPFQHRMDGLQPASTCLLDRPPGPGPPWPRPSVGCELGLPELGHIRLGRPVYGRCPAPPPPLYCSDVFRAGEGGEGAAGRLLWCGWRSGYGSPPPPNTTTL